MIKILKEYINSVINENSNTKTLELIFPDKIKKINVEISKKSNEIKKGLMFRKSCLGDSNGMLFIMPESAYHHFWMKNTYIPLDVIFFNEHGEFIDATTHAQPLSEQNFTASGKSKYILEVDAGFCDKYKIDKKCKMKL